MPKEPAFKRLVRPRVPFGQGLQYQGAEQINELHTEQTSVEDNEKGPIEKAPDIIICNVNSTCYCQKCPRTKGFAKYRVNVPRLNFKGRVCEDCLDALKSRVKLLNLKNVKS